MDMDNMIPFDYLAEQLMQVENNDNAMAIDDDILMDELPTSDQMVDCPEIFTTEQVIVIENFHIKYYNLVVMCLTSCVLYFVDVFD